MTRSSDLLISTLFVDPGKVGGAENYLTAVLKSLVVNSCLENTTLIVDETLLDKYDKTYSEFKQNPISIKRNRRLYDLLLPFYADLKSFDSVFFPNYLTPFSKKKKDQKWVTTIHDLQYLHYPELTSSVKRKWLYLMHQITLRNADKIICISDFVKEDILTRYGKKYQHKLITIPNAVDFTRFGNDQGSKDFEYILSVNSLYPHKNTLSLINAYKKLKQLSPNAPKLVLVGQLPENLVGNDYQAYQKTIVDAIKGEKDIVMTGYVNDEELGQWYANAKIFVNTSLFEGFGMTAIEAMGFGIPTVTSSYTSLKEVTLGKAIYLNDPKNHEAVTEIMNTTLMDIDKHKLEAQANQAAIRAHYSLERIGAMYKEVLFNNQFTFD